MEGGKSFLSFLAVEQKQHQGQRVICNKRREEHEEALHGTEECRQSVEFAFLSMLRLH